MKKVLLSALVLGLGLISCKKETTEPEVEESAKVKIMLEHQFNGEPLDFETDYINANGDTIILSELKYFLSNLVLMDNDGNEQAVEESYYLVELGADNNINNIEINGLKEGSYTSFKLGLGVDSVANHSTADAKGDLDPNGADQMIWSWSTGYKFVRCEGDFKGADSTGSFVFHIGKDENYKTFHFGAASHTGHEVRQTSDGNLAISLENDKTTEIHLVVDLAEFFVSPNQIDIQEVNKAHGDNASVLMDIIYESEEDGHYGLFELQHIQTN